MEPGLYPDFPEAEYHDDPCETPSLSASIAKALVHESPAHAHLYHPRFGGESFKPTKDMDRGTLCHALLLGKGPKIAIVECEDWKKKGDQELRDLYRSIGRLPVTRKVYDAGARAAEEIEKKLRARGYILNGKSEVTLIWDEHATNGAVVRCRARVDHLIEQWGDIWDLKITGNANPSRLRSHTMDMGYPIQGAAYMRGLGRLRPELLGRCKFELLYCEPEPPYCISPARCTGSAAMIGDRQWQRGINRWERCLRENHWPDYVEGVTLIEAKPWEFEEEMSHALE